MIQTTRYWLAGLLEGEGSFMVGPPSKPNLPVISVNMTDKDVVEKVAELFGTKVLPLKKRKQKWKDNYATRVRGKKAVEIMMVLKPLMGTRRQHQIEKALASYSVQGRRLTDKEVISIRQLCSEGKMTQKQIAKKFDLRRETVNKIHRRKRHLFT